MSRTSVRFRSENCQCVLTVGSTRCRALASTCILRPPCGLVTERVMTTASTWATRALMARRVATLGPHSPTFYEEPLHVVSGMGVWLRGADGVDYLDAYNNVPHVGHGNPVVVAAIAEQAARLNVHTRYLSEPVVDYAEALLATATPRLNRVLSPTAAESNDPGVADPARPAHRQHRRPGHGLLLPHGNTARLAEAYYRVAGEGALRFHTSEPCGSPISTPIRVPSRSWWTRRWPRPSAPSRRSSRPGTVSPHCCSIRSSPPRGRCAAPRVRREARPHRAFGRRPGHRRRGSNT